MAQLQTTRPIAVSTPLGDDVLLFHRMIATEELGRLFAFKLDLLSTDEQIRLEDVLGQAMTVRLDLPDSEERYFNGFVGQFSYTGRYRNYATYEATLRPWLWFLTQNTDCRIFQEKTVPDIIKEVFRGHGFTDFEESLSESYRTWEYCVQYRETDFNFISRLMEKEGIYYYFKHEEGKHTLVLSDSIIAHERIPGYEQIPYYPPSENAVRERDHIYDWRLSQEVQPGAYVLDDFDFERPKAELQVKLTNPGQHAASEFEIYDYPGEYLETSEGEVYVRARLEELHAQFEHVQGEGNIRGLSVGGLFELTNYPREDQNREYLVVSAKHELFSEPYETGESSQTIPLYTCHFKAIESQRPYRTPRVTPKPVVQGPQTAIVVGKVNEEIWTDKHGRVKVQFHWDRKGQHDENSSCWIRVSHPWAGKGWGSIAIPRIGQEVIVDFLEGDPDRPIITGRVYNGLQTPPHTLPAGAVISGLKSNSTKGGGGYNEIIMDDTKGNELIRLHGQFDMDSTIENDLREHVLNNRSRDVAVDETISVGSNRAKTVGADQSESIGANKTIDVGANHTESIGANMSLSVGSNETETVKINKAETIGVAKELTIGGLYQVTVGAAMNETIGAAKAEEIGAAKSVNVGLNSSENIGVNKSVDAGSNISESAGKDVSVSSGKKMSFSAGDDYSVNGAKKGVINIADELTISCGKAVIQMKKDGTININGKDIAVKGSGEIKVKANKNITMKAKKILQN